MKMERTVFQNEKPRKKVEPNSGGTLNSVHGWFAYTKYCISDGTDDQ